MVLGITLRRKRKDDAVTDDKASVVESPSLPNIAPTDLQWPSDLITDVPGETNATAQPPTESSSGREPIRQPGGPTLPYHRPFRKDSTTSLKTNVKPRIGQDSPARSSIASIYVSMPLPSFIRPPKDSAPPAAVVEKATRSKRRPPHIVPTFNIMVVGGAKTGKTSMSRLLLQTCQPSPLATTAQRESVDNFMRGIIKPTSSVQSASLEIDEGPERIILNLMDTPGLILYNELDLERSTASILRHFDNRFAETLEEENKVDRRNTGDRHVHLCIYMIAPDAIRSQPVSRNAPTSHAPVTVQKETTEDTQAKASLSTAPSSVEAHTNSTLQSPKANGSSLNGPALVTNEASTAQTSEEYMALADADIYVIKRLSTRVNVLPVISRSDTLTNERLEEVKAVVQRDLKKGGFHTSGILGQLDNNASDEDAESDEDQEDEAEEEDSRTARTVVRIRPTRGSPEQPKRHPSFSQRSRSRTRAALTDEDVDFERTAAVFPKGVRSMRGLFPFAIMSPDTMPSISLAEANGDKASMPTTVASPPGAYRRRSVTLDAGDHLKGLRGKYTRNYRWGSVDVLNPEHCDFLALRHAILGPRMRVLKQTTNEILYEKFRTQKLLELKKLTRPPRPTSPSAN